MQRRTVDVLSKLFMNELPRSIACAMHEVMRESYSLITFLTILNTMLGKSSAKTRKSVMSERKESRALRWDLRCRHRRAHLGTGAGAWGSCVLVPAASLCATDEQRYRDQIPMFLSI